MHIAGDTARAADAGARILAAPPDAVLSGTRVEGAPALPLLTEPRDLLPATTIMVLAARHDEAELEALARLHIGGYFLWADMEDPAFLNALRVALGGAFTVAGREPAAAYVDARAARQQPGAAMELTARELAVLRGLAAGETRQQIALREDISMSRLKRILRRMRTTLDAPDTITLLLKARELGLIL